MTVTLISNGVFVVTGLMTGVLTARLLEADGRGEVAAVVAWTMMLELMSSLGFKEAVVYEFARHPERARPIFGTTVALSFLTALVGVALVQLVLPIGLASQSDALISAARLFMLMVVPMMLAHATYGLLTATQRFTAAAVQRVAQPILMAVSLVTLWQVDAMTVNTVLTAHFVTWSVVAAVTTYVLWRTIGIARPSLDVARRAFRYGLRVHGQALGTMANVRLDMMIMPAFVLAADIGLYAVAVSAASVVMPLFAQLRPVLFSVAASSDRDRGVGLVEKTMRVALVGSTTISVGLGLFAPFLIETVYGREFQGSVTPLRLLLPGIIAWSVAALMSSGLNAIGRPLAGSVAQFLGVIVTVVGLAIGIPTLGIRGAAATSSASYVTVFFVQLWMLNREPEFSAARVFSPRLLVADVRLIAGKALGAGNRWLAAKRATAGPATAGGPRRDQR